MVSDIFIECFIFRYHLQNDGRLRLIRITKI